MGGCLSIRIRENVMKCINVKCEGKPAYDIVIESGFGGLSEAFNKLEITGRKLCIVTDSNVGPLYAEQVKNELEKQAIQYMCIHLQQEKRIRLLTQYRMYMNIL